MSTDERRALAIILAIILCATAARWLDRPTPLLDDVAAVDLERLEADSREAKPDDAPRERAPKQKPPTQAAPRGKLDLNTATLAQIDSLPGIGPAVAQRIIAARETKPFRHMADLRNVRGIGPALAARLAPLVLLSADPPPDAEPQVKTAAPVAEPSGPIDLNRGTAAELERLPGVGPALAARLIAWRDSAGGFESWEDVDRVVGVGPALLARLRQSAVIAR